ncbi:methyl-accepting chemotaxis protein [Ideonella sp.]|uniref:methyl-accepting chemotaxis protein n=1 Tax=Ideonella sp. TaxID=1929293 RepID=UPI003BB7CFF7
MSKLAGVSSGFNRLGIGAQLRWAFAAVLLFTGILGAVSFVVLTRVADVSADLAGRALPGAADLAATRAALLEVRDWESKASRAADAGYLGDYLEKQEAAARAMREHHASFQQKINTDEERQLEAAFSKALAAWGTAGGKIIELAKAGKMDDAREISEGAGQMSADEAVAALDKLTTHHFAEASALAQQAETLEAQARYGVMGLTVAAVLLGMGLAAAMTRRLLALLGGEPAQAMALASAVAEGDLSTRIALRAGDDSSVMARLMAMQDSLSQVVKTVREGSENVATASAEIAQGNNDLSSRTEQQASALEETAASMEELGSAVNQNADSARQADALARGASDVAARGGAAVSQVVDTMKRINDSSRKIADITGVIDGIAFQTNILALNAAVEAARAGEQGRGFAVVASEVRSLAQRSADAAREIKSLIAASVERVEQGSVQVNQAGETMAEVVSSIQRVTQIVNEISSASSEQSAGVRQVGDAVSQMDHGTQQNAALVEQSAAAAESLKNQAQALVQAVSVFKLHA